MPKRVRSHELEDESIRRFEDALPAQWVYRIQRPDYGIDGSVEIFEPDGSSTGLSFLVQLRATDDPAKADRVRIETDELEYYRQFDQPVAVVRYCSATGAIRWQWASMIRSRVELADGQQSATYRYRDDEHWSSDAPASVRRSLEVRRALRTFAVSSTMPVRIDIEAVPAADQYVLDRALARVIAESDGALARAGTDPQPVEVTLRFEPGFLSVSIDTVTGITFDLVEPTTEIFLTYMLHGLAHLFHRQRLSRHAEAVAHLIAQRGLPHPDEGLGFTACVALARDLPALTRLAIINGFHVQHNVYHGAIALLISRAPQSDADRRAAKDAFFEASLAAADADGASQGAAHYSIANFYRSQRDLVPAIRHYNQGRRLRPAYLAAGYFLRELAGVAYLAGHHGLAVCAYRAALQKGDDPDIVFLLGDALLLAGKIGEARECFSASAAQCAASAMVHEAELKLALCDDLMAEYGAIEVPRRRSNANLMLRGLGGEDAELLASVLRDVDALHPLAHFNLGIARAGEGDHRAALRHFLLCAFLQPQDLAAWSNATICSFGVDGGAVTFAILSVAIRHMGADAYDHLRSDLVGQGAAADMLVSLDTIAMQLLAEAESTPDQGITLRMLDGDDYHSLTVTGPGPA